MANPTASPGPVTINEKMYRMSPLTDRNIGEINNFIRSNLIRATRQSLDADTSEADKQLVIRAAISEASKLDWMSQPDLLQAPDVLVYMFWLSFSKETDCTHEEFASDLLADPESLDECMDTFGLVQPLMGNQKRARTPTKKVAPKKAPRKR